MPAEGALCLIGRERMPVQSQRTAVPTATTQAVSISLQHMCKWPCGSKCSRSSVSCLQAQEQEPSFFDDLLGALPRSSSSVQDRSSRQQAPTR